MGCKWDGLYGKCLKKDAPGRDDCGDCSCEKDEDSEVICWYYEWDRQDVSKRDFKMMAAKINHSGRGFNEHHI